jgi:hypothetical protein
MTQKYAPIVLIEKTLGNGVHPKAVNRLMELCPTAVVRVYHTRPIERVPFHQIVTMRGKKRYLERLRKEMIARLGGAADAREKAVKEYVFAQFGGSTEVTIAEGPDLPPVAKAIAVCHPEEQFCREVGRAKAFNRALERFANVSIFDEEDARGMGPGDDD